MAFSGGFTKTALFGFGKKKPEPKLTDAHVKKILPHFKKSEASRKKLNAGKISEHEHYDNSQDFINAVANAEAESGVSNDKIYKHMYDNHSK